MLLSSGLQAHFRQNSWLMQVFAMDGEEEEENPNLEKAKRKQQLDDARWKARQFDSAKRKGRDNKEQNLNDLEE